MHVEKHNIMSHIIQTKKAKIDSTLRELCKPQPEHI